VPGVFVLFQRPGSLFLNKVCGSQEVLKRTTASALLKGVLRMSKSPWGWRPTVVRRLINVVQAAGLQVERIEMAPDGRLIVVPRDATTIDAQPTENRNEWDA
jgi:hypothetical protein